MLIATTQAVLYHNGNAANTRYNGYGVSSPQWSAYTLITHSPHVLIGDVEPLIDYSSDASHRIFKVSIYSFLKGPLSISEIYIVEPLLTDSKDYRPPILFPAKYILFLEQIADDSELLSKQLSKELSKDIKAIYHTVDWWKGAICLDPNWTDWTNQSIATKYGSTDREEITAAIVELSKIVLSNGKERKIELLTKMKSKGGLFAKFASDIKNDEISTWK